MIKPNALTIRFGKKVNELTSEVGVSKAFLHTTQAQFQSNPHPILKFKAIWDTGATHSMINEHIVSMLDLTPIDRINVSTAGGNRNANVYLVNMYLPNNLVIQRLRVAEGCLMDELLIGMDIISKGDFAVTNLDGNTYMSFQFPSTRHIDFVKEVQ